MYAKVTIIFQNYSISKIKNNFYKKCCLKEEQQSQISSDLTMM
jgi:hypothetical protein